MGFEGAFGVKHICSGFEAVFVKWRCCDCEVELKEVKWVLKFASLLFGREMMQLDGDRLIVKDV